MTKKNINFLAWNAPIIDLRTGFPTPQFLRQFNVLREKSLEFGDDERVRDAVAAMFVDSADIDFTNNDNADTFTAALTASGATAGTYGDASNIPQITVDAKGRVTSISEVAAGGGSEWTLADSYDFATAANSRDFTGLAGANEILVTLTDITKAANDTVALRVSTNNGSSFFSTSGNYRSIGSTGIASNDTSALVIAGSTTASRVGLARLLNPAVSGPKIIKADTASTTVYTDFVGDNANDIDAIRIFTPGGNNMNGGVARVYTR